MTDCSNLLKRFAEDYFYFKITSGSITMNLRRKFNFSETISGLSYKFVARPCLASLKLPKNLLASFRNFNPFVFPAFTMG